MGDDAGTSIAHELADASPDGAYEIRRSRFTTPNGARAQCRMNDLAWTNGVLTGARPRAVSALLCCFRDLDTTAEECQEGLPAGRR
jgi:hypothetical protein